MDNPKIRKLTRKDSSNVFKFIKKEFAPDEPIMRSFRVFQASGLTGKFISNQIKKVMLDTSLTQNGCFGAFDSNNNLIGIRLGQILDLNNLPKEPNFKWILSMPEVLVPKTLVKLGYFNAFMEFMNYSYAKAFDQCEGCNDKIYVGVALGVARSVRGQGLGKKLLMASIDSAKEQNCSHMYILASGIYSQRIFRDFGFKVISERNYEDFKDKHGSKLVHDEIHKVCQVVSYKI